MTLQLHAWQRIASARRAGGWHGTGTGIGIGIGIGIGTRIGTGTGIYLALAVSNLAPQLGHDGPPVRPT